MRPNKLAIPMLVCRDTVPEIEFCKAGGGGLAAAVCFTVAVEAGSLSKLDVTLPGLSMSWTDWRLASEHNHDRRANRRSL
jgi:hypothetical protein